VRAAGGRARLSVPSLACVGPLTVLQGPAQKSPLPSRPRRTHADSFGRLSTRPDLLLPVSAQKADGMEGAEPCAAAVL